MSLILDLMYAFAQWLRTTFLADVAVWLQATPLNRLVNSNIWIAPVVQTTHILAIAATVAAVLTISLRIFQLAGKSRTLAQTAALCLPWIWTGLVVLLLTGLILILGEPERELLNPFFWSKMTLVVAAMLASLAFQHWVRRGDVQWETSPQGTLVLRAGAAGLLVLWCLIIVAGRWIAYAPT